MRQKLTKRILAGCLTLLMLLGTIAPYVSTQVEAADLTQQTPEELGFSRVTITDFGFGEGGTYQDGSAYKAYTGSDTLDGKYLDVDLQFPTDSSTNAKMHYLASAQGTGLAIWMWTGTTEGGLALQSQTNGAYANGYNKTYKISELGLDSRTEKFNLKLGVKLVGTEVQYTMWVNNVLIAQDVVITGLTSISNGMDVMKRTNTAGGAMIMTVPEIEEEEPTPEELGFSRVTITDFGFGEGGTYQDGSAYKAYTGSDTLDGKYLDVDLQFPTDSSTNAKMHYLASAQGTGLAIWMWTGTTEGGLALQSQTNGAYANGYNKTYKISELGLDSRTEKFNLKLGVKLVGTEVQYTMWINNVLIAQDVVITGLTSISNGMDVMKRTNTAGGAMIMTVPEVEEELSTPEELGFTERVTIADFGMNAGNYGSGASQLMPYNGSNGLDNKYLDVDITFTEDATSGILVYASKVREHVDSGIRIYYWSNRLIIQNTGAGAYDGYYADDLNLDTLINNKFNLKIGVKFNNLDSNGNCDIVYSLWINDVLIAKNVDTLKNATNIAWNANTLMGKTVIYGIPEAVEDSLEQKTPEELGYERITIADFGLAEGTYGGGTTTRAYTGTGSLSNKYLDVDIQFTAGTGTPNLIYASAGQWDGLRIFCWNDMLAINSPNQVKSYTYTAEDLNLEAITDEFNLKLGVRYDDDTKITYTFWVNDVLIAKDVEFTKASGLGLGSNIGMMTGSDASARFTMFIPMDNDEIGYLPLDFQRLTVTDAKLSGERSTNYGEFEVDSLDRTVFSTKLKLVTNGARLHLGVAGNVYPQSYGGISFRLQNGQIIIANEEPSTKDTYGFLDNMPEVLASILPEKAGVGTTFQDTEFILQVSTEFVDNDGDGQKNDIKLGVFINGALYRNRWLYIKDNADKLGTCINSNEGTLTMLAYDYQYKFTELTAADFGLDNKIVKNTTKTAEYDANSLHETAIESLITFPTKAGNRLYLGGEDTGICLQTKDSKTLTILYVNKDKQEVEIGTLTAKKAGVESFSKNNRWRFTFRIYEAGDENRVYLGIYVDENLYDGQCIVLKDIDLSCMKRIVGIQAENGEFRFAAPQYEDLTLIDFNFRDTNLSDNTKLPYSLFNFYDKGNLDGTAITVKVNFGARANQLRVGTYQNGWDGIIYTSYDDTLEVIYSNGGKDHYLGFIRPEKLGMDTLVGTELKLRTTYDLVYTENGSQDLRIGVFINDVLYDYFIVRGVDANSLYRTMRFYTASVPFTIKSVNKGKPDLSIFGF